MVPGALAAPPFSHGIHLAANLKCTACHEAALTSTRADDHLLPTPAACMPCHKTAVIGLPPATRVAHFNHQLHAKLGNVGPVIAAAIDKKTYLGSPPTGLRAQLDTGNPCEACHRGLEASGTSATHMPLMADCLVCHNQIDPPYSCETCHAKGAALKPANHTPDFLDAHTTGKLGLDEATCAVCHGRHFRCMGCH